MDALGKSDETLMRAVGKGDLDALGVLFERHHVVLFNFFRRVTGQSGVAEDLVQDVFFRMLKYRETFRDDSRFKAWMFHIARNARVDYFRKRKVEPIPSDPPLEPASPIPFPSEQFEQAEDRALLERALLQLAPDKREVLMLARFQELRYDEIAQLLGVSAGAVKVRVHRAVGELRSVFFQLSRNRTPCTVKDSKSN